MASSLVGRAARLLFIFALVARGQDTPFQDAHVSDALPQSISDSNGDKWLELEKVARDAVEQAAATEAFVASLATEEGTKSKLMLMQTNAMQNKIIDGMKEAVAVMRLKASQEALKGAEAKVRLGCAFGCSGHGTCDRSSRQCACSEGWLGEMCDQPRCLDDCNGNGACVSGKCACHEGWLGSSCEKARCPGDCSGNGYCFQGECMCSELWSGENCSIPVHTHGDLRALLRLSVAASSHEKQSAEQATVTTSVPTAVDEAPHETVVENLGEVDSSEKDVPWQHWRAQAMRGATHDDKARPQGVEAIQTNATSFEGAPLTAEWIAPVSSDEGNSHTLS